MNQKIITVVIALGVSVSTCAASNTRWTLIREDKVDATFADYSTAKRIAQRVKIWTLTNNKTVVDDGDGKPVGSDMAQQEYDCEQRQVRTTYRLAYAGPLGTGTVLRSFTPSNIGWRPIVPGSVGESMMVTVCSTVR